MRRILNDGSSVSKNEKLAIARLEMRHYVFSQPNARTVWFSSIRGRACNLGLTYTWSPPDLDGHLLKVLPVLIVPSARSPYPPV